MWLFLWTLLACGLGEGEGGPSGPPAALVRVAPVEAGELEENWSTLAEVQALQSADLAVGAAGPVSSVDVREGARVGKGDVLLSVDRSLIQAQVDAAGAAVREARAELQRREAASSRRRSVTDGVLAQEEVAEAEAAVAIQQARLDGLVAAEKEARALLRRHLIIAPFAGIVSARMVDPGDWVTVGQPALQLVSIEDVEVRVRIPRELISRLSEGQVVHVGGNAGTIEAIVPALDPTTRTALVRITPKPPHGLTPGQPVDVRLPIAWTGVGVKVPRDAVVSDPRQDRVWKVMEGAAQSVPVEVIASGETEVLVTSDNLSVGDQVITRGNERVRPGQPVRFEGAE